MSASTSTSVSAGVPTVQQLLSAVQSNAAPYLTIQSLFCSALDTPGERSNMMDARIMDARRVYQIVQAGTPPFAVFYKLTDPEKIEVKISEAFYKVKGAAAKRPRTYEDVRAQIEYFEDEGNDLERQAAKAMSQHLLVHMNTHHKKDDSRVTGDEIMQLFNEALRSGLVNTMLDSFFTVPNRETAGHVGTMYDPKNNDTHNWGVNAVWTAALAARGTPIKVLSPLLLESGKHPTDTQFTPGSSAFALEIAIAVKMGYRLKFSPPDKAELSPPSTPNLDVTLPTREEQEQIYDWCCSKRAEAIQQFTATSTSPSASNSSITFPYPPTSSLNSTPVSINAQVPHIPPVASLLSQFQLQQSKAAAHAISADTPDPKQKPTPSTSSGIQP